MKRIVMFFMSTLTAVVLLFGYHTSTSSRAVGGETAFVSTAQGGSLSSSPASAVTVPTASAAATTATAAPTTVAAASSTVTGDVADTRWGPVQVQPTLQNGKITDVSVIQYPNGNGKDEEINATALPILVQETKSAQSAKIDMVSGATVTSEGYVNSLQSALDKAAR